MQLQFRDRHEGGGVLLRWMRGYEGRGDVIVLGLPRGGVPIAVQLAQGLGAQVDVMVVRKLGTPGHEELAIGAIAGGGVRLLNDELLERLNLCDETVEGIVRRETEELHRRERAYRGDRPRPVLEGRCVVLVDDGLATGWTMRAAVAACRRSNPSRIVVAVPVAPPQTVAMLRREADEVVCPSTPIPFRAVSQWYQQFDQVSDGEVQQLLNAAWAAPWHPRQAAENLAERR